MKRLSVKLILQCTVVVAMLCVCVSLSFAGGPLFLANRFVALNSIADPSTSTLSVSDPARHSKVSENSELSTSGAPVVYDRVVLTEDTTLRGRVLIRGYLVVAPQATLRIEPGTVVLFEATVRQKQDTRLVVQGRISAVGTVSSPVLLTSDRSRPSRGDWGGVYLVSTEKRNQLEHCRIEYAKYGIDARFSSVNLKMVSILNSSTALLSRDATVQVTGGVFAESDNGIEMTDSELDAKDLLINANNHGISISRSSANMSNLNIRDNRQYGVRVEDSRIKISNGEISANSAGVRINGGEGQINTTIFNNNRDTALHVSNARIKVSRNQFVRNKQDAIRIEDGRVLILGNSFSSNSGYNVYNSGTENVVALMNWWESTDSAEIALKIFDSDHDQRMGRVLTYPWMDEKPAYHQ